ncbi:MAG: ferrous iron transport protein B [Bacteroidales bacterium]|nr:ferrous iron transport protein B [Bacteroidales bacterium]
MTLLELAQGEKAFITKVKGRGAFRKRIMEMGFVAGREITAVRKAPLGDPIEYNIMGYNVTLRNAEAQLVEVITLKDLKEEIKHETPPEAVNALDDKFLSYHAKQKGKVINIAFVGNPNAGKTSLFNQASGLHERTGNYGGVTIESKEARFWVDGYQINVTDLPGTYSITAYSPEELYVRKYIQMKAPDIVVNVLDASNLERNLYLTTQLIDMDIRVVIALNMYDDMERNGDRLKHEYLGQLLGMPIIPTVGSKGKGVKELLRTIIRVYEGNDPTSRHIHISYGKAIEMGIQRIQEALRIPENRWLTDRISSRFLAIKLLEKDAEAEKKIKELQNYTAIKEATHQQISILEAFLKEDTETIITDAKYGFIAGAIRETYVPARKKRIRKSDLIDLFFTHKFYAFPIFLLIMWAIFYLTFTLGAYPQQWIEGGITLLGTSIDRTLGEGIFKDFLINGIIGGVGGVLVFIPNIILLYFFISLLEDSGYMARAVFIMDKAMHRIGLHGKSFIPLIMGFGCNVPAIMATRIIESRRDRLITMLITPFMSCGARLPVYILFISAFFEHNRGTILFAIYLVGILVAIATALFFNKTFFRKQEIPFVMELPPYRIPTTKSVFKHMWLNTAAYIKKIGGVVLVATMIIWVLGYFPRNKKYTMDYPAKIEQLKVQSAIAEVGSTAAIEQEISQLKLLQSSEQQEKSYIGKIGKTLEPVMRPLGFDWKMTCAIIAGLPAKEVVVGTLGVLFPPELNDHNEQNLAERIRNQVILTGPNQGKPLFTPLIAVSFMLFILIYFPCIGVIAAIRKESGQWKYALFEIFYTTGLAWVISFAVFQIGSLIIG